MSNINDILTHTFDQNPAGIQRAFNQELGSRLLDAIEAKKAEIGANLLNTPMQDNNDGEIED